jgi:hypothetical protein
MAEGLVRNVRTEIGKWPHANLVDRGHCPHKIEATDSKQ